MGGEVKVVSIKKLGGKEVFRGPKELSEQGLLNQGRKGNYCFRGRIRKKKSRNSSIKRGKRKYYHCKKGGRPIM